MTIDNIYVDFNDDLELDINTSSLEKRVAKRVGMC